ncbi:MAG: hypothetical protein RIT27_137 [Pseudomonadota bacterium]|jgi:hypothetical protein
MSVAKVSTCFEKCKSIGALMGTVQLAGINVEVPQFEAVDGSGVKSGEILS